MEGAGRGLYFVCSLREFFTTHKSIVASGIFNFVPSFWDEGSVAEECRRFRKLRIGFQKIVIGVDLSSNDHMIIIFGVGGWGGGGGWGVGCLGCY